VIRGGAGQACTECETSRSPYAYRIDRANTWHMHVPDAYYAAELGADWSDFS
jgi:hypothetical protein